MTLWSARCSRAALRASPRVPSARRRPSLVRSSLLFTMLALALLQPACRRKQPDADRDGEGDDTGDGDHGYIDLCSSVDCGLHGSCAVSSNNAFCFCHAGYVTSPTGGACVRELSSERSEPEGEHCLFGGTATDTGLDLDDDGALASSEITSTSYACTAPEEPCPPALCGAHGACVLEGNVPSCVCSTGYMGARCDACAGGFVARPADGLCSVPRQITDLRDEADNPACSNGSYAVITGTDADFNGVLDLDEIRESNSLCKVVRAGNVLVTNQAELEALSGITDIAGNLTISTSYVENLMPLSSLIHVQGQLLVAENQALASLAGLGRLHSVESIRIGNNAALTSITGLDALQRSGSIQVFGNPALTRVDLGAIGVIEGDLWLQDNPMLVSIHSGALRSVVKALVLAFHPLLTDLSGLGTLTSVGSEIWLEENAGLVDLAGFAKLADAGGLLVIRGGLSTFEGLGALKSLRGGLTVDGNDLLSSLDGLNGVEIIEGGVLIQRNAQLQSIAGLQNLSTVGGGVSVRENAKLARVAGLTMVSSIKESSVLPASEILPPTKKLAPCNPLLGCVPVPLPPLLVRSRGTRESLPYAVEFSKNPQLTSVSGFIEASQISSIVVGENPLLTSMPSLSLLEGVNSLKISGSGFTSLSFDQLVGRQEGAIGGQVLQVEDNLELTELRLSAPSAVSKLVVEGNPKLIALRWDAMTCYTNASLRIADNVALKTLEGLAKLLACESLTISGNAALVSLEDFSELTSMGSFTLQSNALLEHAPSFPALTGKTLSVTVADNAKLTNVPASAVPFANLTLLDLPNIATLAGTNLGAGTKDVRIENLDKLVNLSGLSGLADQAINSLRLIDNDQLTSLLGMGKLLDVNGLSIVGNDSLKDLVGFSELTQIGPLEIKGNLVLPSLSDLTKLTSVTGGLTITGNPALPNCQAIALKNEVYPAGNVANNDMAATCH